MRRALLALCAQALACGDSELPTLNISVRAPAPIDQPGGACPAGPGPRLSEAAASDPLASLRLTVLDPGDPAQGVAGRFLCDRVIPVGQGNTAEVLVPDHGPRIDLVLEAYGPAPPAGPPPLKYSGERRGVNPNAGVVEVVAYPSQRFGCSPAHLTAGRAFHSATALPDGSVLLAGGLVSTADPTRLAATGEIDIYDPATGQLFAPADNRASHLPRAFHHAVALPGATPPYAVLLLGGLTPAPGVPPDLAIATIRTMSTDPFRISPIGSMASAAAAEIVLYDPATHVLSSSGVQPGAYEARMLGAATEDPAMLAAVAVAGGASALSPSGFQTVPSIQLGDRASGTLLAQSVLAVSGRVGATLSPLGASQALLFGGDLTAPQGMEAVTALEVISGIGTPSLTSAVPPLVTGSVAPTATAFHTATPIDAQNVLVLGGFVVSGAVMVGTETFSGVAIDTNDAAPVQLVSIGSLGVTVTRLVLPFTAVGYHAATVLSGTQKLLVSGGSPAASAMSCGSLCAVPTAYLFDLASMSIAPVTPGLVVERYGHRQTELPDGTVLVTGGLRYVMTADTTIPAQALDSVEVYNPHDASYDRAALPPFSVTRAPGQEASPATHCLTRAEYQKMHP